MTALAAQVDEYRQGLPPWQRELLGEFRALVHQVEPAITEGWKRNMPVFLLGKQTIYGMAAFKTHVKYNFLLNGAQLDDPDGVFNAGADSKRSLGIDLGDGDRADRAALQWLLAGSVQLATDG